MSHAIKCFAPAVATISARSPRKPRGFTPRRMAAGRQPAYCGRIAAASYDMSSAFPALVHAQIRVGLGYQRRLRLCQLEKLPGWPIPCMYALPPGKGRRVLPPREPSPLVVGEGSTSGRMGVRSAEANRPLSTLVARLFSEGVCVQEGGETWSSASAHGIE